MSRISDNMKAKGYTPLADSGAIGIGFKKSIHKEGGMLDKIVWFDTGKVMEDGETPRTVGASDKIQYDEYIAKGWKPIAPVVVKFEDDIPEVSDESASSEVPNVATTKKRGRPKK